MLVATTSRVAEKTAESINLRIHRWTEASIARHAAGGPDAIARRLFELDREWDVERWVETLAPTFSLVGLALGLTRNPRWLALPVVVQAFFLQHALQGWCPPIPFLRRLGVRTASEIEAERHALKALRGDFRDVIDPRDAAAALAAVKR